MSKRAIYLVPLSVFLVMAVYFAIGLTKDPKIIPSALIDKLIPEFSLPPIDNGTPQGYGKGFSSADPRGRVGHDPAQPAQRHLASLGTVPVGPTEDPHDGQQHLAHVGVGPAGRLGAVVGHGLDDHLARPPQQHLNIERHNTNPLGRDW